MKILNKVFLAIFLLFFLFYGDYNCVLAQQIQDEPDSLHVFNKPYNQVDNQNHSRFIEKKDREDLSPSSLQGNAVNVDLTSDKLEYFEDKDEIVATGAAQLVIDAKNAKLQADKIIFDQTNGIVTADGNVKLLKNGKLILGDYAKINMNTESALIDKPNTFVNEIKIIAKTANIYSNRIDAFKGNALLNNDGIRVTLSSAGMGGAPHIISKIPQALASQMNSQSYKLVTKELIVKNYPDKNVIAIKNADVIMGNITVAKIPYLEITSDKETGNIEDELPEIGYKQQLGWYGGPSHVFSLPDGGALKTSPLLSNGVNGFGGGLFARFSNSSNKTEFAYTTSKNTVIFQGEQKAFSPFTKLIYGGNEYVDNGIFGPQMPKYIAEVVDNRKLASAMNFSLYQRSSLGYAQDVINSYGTARFQLQGTVMNDAPLFSFKDYLHLGITSQYDVSLYGDGSKFGLVRAGPSLYSKIGPLTFNTTYFQAAMYGQSPFLFDKFLQGKSNVVMFSDLKLCKYLNFGYIASLNLLKDNWNHTLLTENQFYISVGPQDVKIRIGFDAIRKSSNIGLDLLLGQGKTPVDFDKMKYYQYEQ